jgi:hypothetical protein
VEWFRHNFKFLIRKSPWRWASVWPKHVSDHNSIKKINKMEVHLFGFNIFCAANECTAHEIYQTHIYLISWRI